MQAHASGYIYMHIYEKTQPPRIHVENVTDIAMWISMFCSAESKHIKTITKKEPTSAKNLSFGVAGCHLLYSLKHHSMTSSTVGMDAIARPIGFPRQLSGGPLDTNWVITPSTRYQLWGWGHYLVGDYLGWACEGGKIRKHKNKLEK